MLVCLPMHVPARLLNILVADETPARSDHFGMSVSVHAPFAVSNNTFFAVTISSDE